MVNSTNINDHRFTWNLLGVKLKMVSNILWNTVALFIVKSKKYFPKWISEDKYLTLEWVRTITIFLRNKQLDFCFLLKYGCIITNNHITKVKQNGFKGNRGKRYSLKTKMYNTTWKLNKSTVLGQIQFNSTSHLFPCRHEISHTKGGNVVPNY